MPSNRPCLLKGDGHAEHCYITEGDWSDMISRYCLKMGLKSLIY